MELLSNKATDDTLPAIQWNQVPKESENVIIGTEQVLAGGDLNQLGKGIASYVANGTFYTDSGIANAYVLTSVGPKQSPTAYTNGFKAEFITSNNNTGASTVNVAGIGSKDIKTQGNSDPIANNIAGFVTLIFNSGTDSFELTNPNITSITADFDTVQDMKDSVTLVVGAFARTLGYITPGDGGANDYSIVTAGEGTDDGGTFIDLPGSATQAKGLFNDDIVRFEQYGAAGDGVTDDTVAMNNATLNPVLDHIEISGKTFRATDTIKFSSLRSYIAVYGKSQILNEVSSPIIASQAFFLAENAVPLGRMTLHNLEIFGSLESAIPQIGFVLHDFFCDIRFVRVGLCKLGGLQITHRNDQGDAIAGNLIANTLASTIISNCGGIGIDLGEPDNNTIADGWLIAASIQMKIGEPVTSALRCGSANGWYMTGVHTFGAIPPVAVDLRNSSRTRFVNFEVESFSDCGVNASSIQGDTVIQGHLNANSASTAMTGRAVDLGLSGAVTNAGVSVDIGVQLDVVTTGLTCVNNQIGAGDIQIRVRRRGLQRDLLQIVTAPDDTRLAQVRFFADASVAGVFTDKANVSNQIGLAHDGKRLSYNFYGPSHVGSGVHTVTVPVRLTDFQKLIGTVNIEFNTFHDNVNNGSVYQGRFFLSAKVNGTDAWVKNLLTTIPPSGSGTGGFLIDPVLTVVNTTGDDGTIVITFTLNNSDSTGICSVTF